MRPLTLFFIGVRSVAVFVFTTGIMLLVTWMSYFILEGLWSNPTSSRAMGPALGIATLCLALGTWAFLFADALATKWTAAKHTSVSAVFIALVGLFLMSNGVRSLPNVIGEIIGAQVFGGSASARDRFLSALKPVVFRHESYWLLSGLSLFVAARPLSRLLDTETTDGWLYRRRLANAVRDMEDLKD